MFDGIKMTSNDANPSLKTLLPYSSLKKSIPKVGSGMDSLQDRRSGDEGKPTDDVT